MGLAVSTTSTIRGRDVILKAISNAAMYKTVDVSFYDNFTPAGSSTSTNILLGTNTFQNSTTAPLVVNDLGTGTHSLYVTWPGENKFAPVSTSEKPVEVVVIPGASVGGTISLYVNPASGTVVIGEGNITLTLLINTVVPITGNIIFYDLHTPLGNAPIVNGSAQLTFDSALLTEGNHTLTASWNGANINGIEYEGIATSITYNILRGTTLGGGLTISATPNHGIFGEGNITFVSTLTTSTSISSGTVSFYNQDTQAIIANASVINNVATAVVTNNFAVGTYTIVSRWDGNQSSHPRYIEKTSSALTFNEYERETITSFVLDINPTDTYFSEPITFTAHLTAPSAVPGKVYFSDNGNLIGSADIVNNVASISTATLTVGSHALVASYSGSSSTPKYYSSLSNTINTVTSAGYPMSFTLAYSPNTYLDPTPGYYINEPIPLSLTANTTTSVTGTVATITVDDKQKSERIEICVTNGNSSTIHTNANDTDLVAGTKMYLDQANTNLIGTISQIFDITTVSNIVVHDFFNNQRWTIPVINSITGTNLIAVDMSLAAPPVSNISSLGSGLLIPGNTLTEYLIGGIQSTTIESIYKIIIDPQATGNLTSADRALIYNHPLVNKRSIIYSDTPVNLPTVPVWFVGPHYNPLGLYTFTNSNTISTTATFVSTGSMIAYADWLGGLLPDGHYYAEEMPYASTITVTTRTLPKLYLKASTSTYYVGEPVTFSLTDNSSTHYYNYDDFATTIKDNNSTVGVLPYIARYYSSGTHSLQGTYGKVGYVHNPIDSNRIYYFNAASTVTNIVTATFIDRYLGAPITLSEVGDPDYQGEALNIVLYTTSTENLSGTTATIYVNGIASTQTTFIGTIATATVAINATGTFILSGYWYGRSVPSGKYFHGQATTTATEIVTWHTIPSISLTTTNAAYIDPTGIAYYPEVSAIILQGTLNTSTVLGGTLSLLDNGTTISTGTFVNNNFTTTIVRGILSLGSHNTTLFWNGTRTVPYYFSKTSNAISYTILPYRPPITTLTIPTFYYYNQDNTRNTNTLDFTLALLGVNSSYTFGPAIPTGTVTFTKPSVGYISTVSVNSGTATVNMHPSNYNDGPGTSTIYASYSGDIWNSSTVVTGQLNIVKPIPQLSLTASSTASFYLGNPFTLTISKPTNTVMTGTITLVNQTTSATIGTYLFNNANSIPVNITPANTFTNQIFVARYPETQYHQATNTSTSVTITKESPIITIIQPTTIMAGSNWTLPANIYRADGVTKMNLPLLLMYANGQNIATLTADSNKNYSYTFTSIPGGTYQYKATSSEQPLFAAATSNIATLIVNKWNPGIVLLSSNISRTINSQYNSGVGPRSPFNVYAPADGANVIFYIDIIKGGPTPSVTLRDVTSNTIIGTSSNPSSNGNYWRYSFTWGIAHLSSVGTANYVTYNGKLFSASLNGDAYTNGATSNYVALTMQSQYGGIIDGSPYWYYIY